MTVDQAILEIQGGTNAVKRRSTWRGKLWSSKRGLKEATPTAVAVLPPTVAAKQRKHAMTQQGRDSHVYEPRGSWMTYTHSGGGKPGKHDKQYWVNVNTEQAELQVIDTDGDDDVIVARIPMIDIVSVELADTRLTVTTLDGAHCNFATGSVEDARRWKGVLLTAQKHRADRTQGLVKADEEKLKTFRWFHPGASRAQAEAILRDGGVSSGAHGGLKEGTFVVRSSDLLQANFVLSLVANGGMVHSLITVQEHGKPILKRYRMLTHAASAKFRVEFQSLPELVLNYQMEALPNGTRLRSDGDFDITNDSVLHRRLVDGEASKNHHAAQRASGGGGGGGGGTAKSELPLWNKGFVDRAAAEAALNGKPPGAFVLRFKKGAGCVISATVPAASSSSGKGIVHHLVTSSGDDWFIDKKPVGVFRSVDSLVATLMNETLGVLHCKLVDFFTIVKK